MKQNKRSVIQRKMINIRILIKSNNKWLRVIMDSPVVTIIHTIKSITNTVPIWILSGTKYDKFTDIEINDSTPFHENVVTDYKTLKTDLLKDRPHKSRDNFLEYHSMIRFCRLLEDQLCLNQLIDELFLIQDYSMFNEALDLFTTKELWKYVITSNDIEFNVKHREVVSFLNKLYTDQKRYRKYMYFLFRNIVPITFCYGHFGIKFGEDLDRYVHLIESGESESESESDE